jgi:hypothetical protein
MARSIARLTAGGKRHQGDLVALAVHAQHPVAVLFAEVANVAAGGLEDPQPEQTQHRDQGEVEPIHGLSGRGQHGLELQMSQPEARGLGRHVRAAHVLGRGVLENAVDHAGPIETGDDRQPARHRRWPVSAHLL